MTLNAQLAELRRVAHDAPSPESMGILLALLELWPEEELEVARSYLRPHLERWPDALRAPPPAARSAYRTGAVLPRGWELVRAYSVILVKHGPEKVACIKALTRTLGWDVRSGKEAAEDAPTLILDCVGLAEAERVAQRVSETHAEVTILPLTSVAPPEGVGEGEQELSRADLRGARLARANLREVRLWCADLSRADLSEADLRGADLTGARCAQAKLPGADLQGARLSGVNLSGVDLTGANLRGACLAQANLRGADLTGADLTGAELSGATWDARTRWPGSPHHRSIGPQHGGVLRRVAGLDLSGFDMTKVGFVRVRACGVVWRGAVLREVDLRGARLEGADFTGSRFVDCQLRDARYDARTRWPAGFDPTEHGLLGPDVLGPGGDFSRRDLSLMNLRAYGLRRATFRQADLEGVCLAEADLMFADLTQANLRSAELPEAILVNADLRRADLSGANLSGANLAQADLRGTNLGDADLCGANLEGARLELDGPGATYLDNACYDGATRWPHDGFVPPVSMLCVG